MRRKKGRQLLGIDIGPAVTCVVEMRGGWPHPEVLRAEAAPTPTGAVDNGQIVDLDAVCNTLRGLIDRLGTKTRDAVMGVSARSVTTRVLDIPAVPPDEIAAVVEGEIAHQKILREPGGAFDFMPLQPSGGAAGGPQVLVMAAEETAISFYRVIADRVGLKLIALEPNHSAMYRAASPQVYSRLTCLCVTVGPNESEISIVDDGKIRLYRRVDTGSDGLLGKAVTRRLNTPAVTRSLNPDRMPLGGRSSRYDDDDEDDDDDDDDDRRPVAGGMDVMSASALALEIQRSMDYYSREYPEATHIDHIVVATDVPGVHPFVEWLRDALHVDTSSVNFENDNVVDVALRSRLQPPDGLRYVTAGGLAMRELANVPPSVPKFDLTGQQKAEKAEASARKRLLVGVTAATIILCYGLFTAIMTGMRARAVARDLDASRTDLKNLQQIKSVRIDQMEKQKTLLARLKLDGLPLPRVMDAVAVTIPAHVGLTDVSLSKTGLVSIGGEAATDRMLISMLEGLKNSPMLENTSLDSFDSSNSFDTSKPSLVHFQISSQLVGIKHPKVAPPPPPKTD